jgi:hypothetical protein
MKLCILMNFTIQSMIMHLPMLLVVTLSPQPTRGGDYQWQTAGKLVENSGFRKNPSIS